MLQSEAAFAHSPNERKAQISSINNISGKAIRGRDSGWYSMELTTIYFQQRLFVD